MKHVSVPGGKCLQVQRCIPSLPTDAPHSSSLSSPPRLVALSLVLGSCDFSLLLWPSGQEGETRRNKAG